MKIAPLVAATLATVIVAGAALATDGDPIRRINAAVLFAGVGGAFKQTDVTAISRLTAKRIVAAAASRR